MRKALITLLLIASTGAYGQMYSRPNILGGEDFYDNGRRIGHTSRNITGGRDFHPSPSTIQMQRNAIRDLRRHRNSHNLVPLPKSNLNWDW